MNIKIKRVTKSAKLPTCGTEYSAGYDLYSDEHTIVGPGSTVMVSTGISVAIPEGYFGAIFARSGLAAKQGLRPSNCVGVIDSDYRGTIIVALHNDSAFTRTIQKGDRIAQLIIIEHQKVTWDEVDELGNTNRSSGGFGSTGTN